MLLTRYVALMKNYLIDAARAGGSAKPTPTVISESTGIVAPLPTSSEDNQTQYIRRLPLDDKYHAIFAKFAKYYEKEAEELRDKTLLKELKIVQSVISRTS